MRGKGRKVTRLKEKNQWQTQIQTKKVWETIRSQAAEIKRLDGLLGRAYDTIRAIAVDGLGLSDPSAEDAPAQPPPEWAGLLSEKVAQLRVALQACVRWMRDDDHPLEQFEDIAEWFTKDTGFIRPGKDDVLEFHSYELRHLAFNQWCASKSKDIRDEAQRVLYEPEQVAGQTEMDSDWDGLDANADAHQDPR